MKRFVFGLTLMASSMIAVAILLAACMISPISDATLGDGINVVLHRKGLIPVFYSFVLTLFAGGVLALSSHHRK